MKAGADPKTTLPEGETVLMTAARTGNAEVVKLLLDQGADVGAKEGWHGQSALMWAAAEGHPDVVQVLIDHKADIHAASFQIMPEEAEVVAVASPTSGHAQELATRYSIPRVFTDYRDMLKESDIEMVTITAPNSLHKQMTCDIARAGTPRTSVAPRFRMSGARRSPGSRAKALPTEVASCPSDR